MNRFDLPANFRDFLNTVLKTGVMDGASLVCLGASFGHDWRGMGHDILETAFCGIHEPKGCEHHRTIVKAWDSLNADNAKAVEHLFVSGPVVKAIEEGRPLEMDEIDFDQPSECDECGKVVSGPHDCPAWPQDL